MSDHSITSLIEKLEGAEVGSVELDAQIYSYLNCTLIPRRSDLKPRRRWPDGSVTLQRKVTTSLDAALALAERVLPGHDWSLGHLPTSDDADHQEHHEFGCFFYAHPHVASRQDGLGHGATAPLAMVTAILRAQSAAR
jgi:hypothetical protein